MENDLGIDLNPIIDYFDDRFSSYTDRYYNALEFQKRFEGSLPENLKMGLHRLGTHPKGFELWLWDGRLQSTRVHRSARCEICLGNRLLCHYGAYEASWLCLDCNKEVTAVDETSGRPEPWLF